MTRLQPPQFVEDQRFGIIHHAPAGAGEQAVLEPGCAGDTVQGAGCAFEILLL